MDAAVCDLWVTPVYGFGQCGLRLVFLDFSPQPAEKTHVQIGHRYQRKSRDQIASPVIEQQLKARDVQKDSRDVVAEALLAREKIEEFPLDDPAAVPASGNAPFARLPKDLFMRDSPGD
jgi:hypothetical protein